MRPTGTRSEWLEARTELLKREKELTRLSDELPRQRLERPWVQIDKPYEFNTSCSAPTATPGVRVARSPPTREAAASFTSTNAT